MVTAFFFWRAAISFLGAVQGTMEISRKFTFWEESFSSKPNSYKVTQSSSCISFLLCYHRCLADASCFSLRIKKKGAIYLCDLLSEGSAGSLSSFSIGEWMTYSLIPRPTSCLWPSYKCSKFGTCTRRSNIEAEVCNCYPLVNGTRCEQVFLDLAATSYGFYDPGFSRYHGELYVNGVNQLQNNVGRLRGFIVLTLSMQGGHILEKREWDTWKDPSLMGTVTSYLNMLANNTIVGIVVHNTPSYANVTQDLLDTLSSLSGIDIYLSSQYSFCFFGLKGKPAAAWSIVKTAEQGKGPIHCNTSLVVPLNASAFS